MQAHSVSSSSSCPSCARRIDSHFRFNHLLLSSPINAILTPPPNLQTHGRKNRCFTLTATNSCRNKQEKRRRNPYPYPQHVFLEELCPSLDNSAQTRSTQKKEEQKEGIESESMWWADLKAALGQRFNFGGIVSSAKVVLKDRHLALPHVSVPDIRHIEWVELQRRGFKGVVFDKDNTITAPYSLTLWGPIVSSIEQCKSVFGNDIAVFSNSAGLQEYDPDGCKAGALERGTGIRVVRHRVKKPSGAAEEIERHFSCSSSLLVMVGDRHFTDIVYGNRNGFFTILSEPLSLVEEPFIVTQLRKLEVRLVNRWHQKGLKPPSHSLLPDASQCVKDSRSL